MCGIAGYLSAQLESKERLVHIKEQLLESIRFRGPDDEGFSCIEDQDVIAVLVHTRLSIIGLGAGGHQPMVSKNDRYVLSFNGEIFNYKELIKRYGLSVQTSTDTEVLLLLWEKFGVDCLPLLDGFFAFAIWDQQSKECFLVRDRTGVKPLYYYEPKPGSILFSSDERTFLKSLDLDCNLPVFDENYLNWYKQGKTDVISPWSAVKNIPVGSYVHLKYGVGINSENSENSVLMQTCEWALNINTVTFSELKEETQQSWDSFSSIASKAQQIQEIIEDLPRVSEKAEVLRKQLFLSIARRLQSDVPIGFALSGGLDSSAITAIANLIAGKMTKLSSFSIASTDTDDDESKWQRTMAEFLGTQHRQIETRDFLSSDLPEFVKKTGRPALHWNNIAHFNLCKCVKESGITVLFNGQGADEIFAGYPHYYVRQLLSEWTSLIPHRKKWPIPFSVALRQRLKFLISDKAQVANSYLLNTKNIGEVKRKKSDRMHKSNQKGRLYEVLLNDYFGDRLNQLLRFEDRNGMANQLESRNPFSDDYLLSQWIGISALDENFEEEEEGYLIGELSSRLYNGYSKGLLREALTGILPDEIVYRTDKKGFTVPHAALTLQHFRDWEEAILGVDALSTWWDLESRKNEFKKGANPDLLFQWASLGYFFKFAALNFSDNLNHRLQ